ncbi:MAG: CPBP family glutamic-type intramembrane protease [Bacteroidota bacterium]
MNTTPDLSVPTPSTSAPKPVRGYLAASRTATYGFLSALPLLVLYESSILWANEGRVEQVRVGADVWLKQALAAVGVQGLWLLSGVVVLIGLAILIYERRRSIPLRGVYLAGIVAESAFYAVFVALLVSTAVGLLFAIAPDGGGLRGLDLWTQLALSIGAGLYEELVFRVLLVGGLFWVLERAMKGRTAAYVVAAVVGALLFSAVHYIGAFGDPFQLPSFTFRFLFGLVLNVIFLVRGFGVAAWTHALYDVLVVTGLLG